MAYDRYDTRDYPREERSRWREDRSEDRGWGRGRPQGRDERGFFERAGDEVASWFGDDEAERRRREDRMRDEREGRYNRGYAGGLTGDRGEYGGARSWSRERQDYGRRDREFGPGHDFSYRPMAGDYGRSEQFFAASGEPRGRFGRDFDERSEFGGRDDRSSFGSRTHDPHYSAWRDRHMGELDRDYDDYRRENQSRFESEFGSWRERRQQKRGLLGQVREHMEVVGNDEQHVGTVDRAAGDRIILTKSDPESGGVHHSLSCSDIDRVEGDRVILDCSADQARERWRDESRSRALFEREDQGEMGPRILDRSFEGTYR